MRKILGFILVINIFFKVRSQWPKLQIEDFKIWLNGQRGQCQAMSVAEINFYSVWISRLSRFFNSKNACVIAAATAYVLAPKPVTLVFGINLNPRFTAHAWSVWQGGKMQMDSQRSYESMVEITSA